MDDIHKKRRNFFFNSYDEGLPRHAQGPDYCKSHNCTIKFSGRSDFLLHFYVNSVFEMVINQNFWTGSKLH